MAATEIVIRGASEHNLKRVDLTLPRNKLIVVTGFFFLAILLSLTMSDYGSRMWVNPPALLQ